MPADPLASRPFFVRTAALSCFFEIDLPEYSTKDVMRDKIKYAIHSCVSIDADTDNVDRSDWAF